jgi:hypothetical protein
MAATATKKKTSTKKSAPSFLPNVKTIKSGGASGNKKYTRLSIVVEHDQYVDPAEAIRDYAFSEGGYHYDAEDYINRWVISAIEIDGDEFQHAYESAD